MLSVVRSSRRSVSPDRRSVSPDVDLPAERRFLVMEAHVQLTTVCSRLYLSVMLKFTGLIHHGVVLAKCFLKCDS